MATVGAGPIPPCLHFFDQIQSSRQTEEDRGVPARVSSKLQ